MTSVNSRWPSAWWRHCSEKVFRDNFIIFRHRSKRIAFWNQWIFLRVPICKFSIFVMVTWSLLGTTQGPISAKCLVTDSPEWEKAHLQSFGFPSVPLIWSKTVSCRLCAGYRKGTLKREKCCFWIWLQPRYKIPKIFTIAPVLTSTLTVCLRNRGDPSSLYRT